MYARIENGVAVEYPLFEGDLESRFPALRFPLDDPQSITANGGYVIPDGYVRVEPSLEALDNPRMNYIPGMPAPDVSNVWRVTWSTVSKTTEELASFESVVVFRTRTLRDNKLKESDIDVVIDRWENYTSQQKSELSTYRQALRDIPLQTGFPFDTVWPVKPIIT